MVLASGADAFTAPILHPRLGEAAVRAELAARWRDGGALRIDDALAPGLVAELGFALVGLPFAAHPDVGEVRWRCMLVMPPVVDPQLPAAVWRVVGGFAHELGALVSAITSRAVVVVTPSTVPLVYLRKGSYLDAAPAPAGAIELAIGLTGAAWPAAWGGHTEIVDDAGAVISRWPPAPGAIDLIDAGCRRRVPLLTHHVEAAAIHTTLVPA